MLNRFLSPRLDRLSADGSLTTVAEASAPFLPPLVLLDRELCVFERFASPATGRAARAAARLYGRTAAPFDRTGFIMTPCPGGYGLWWWDLDRSDALLAERFARVLPAAVPETLAQPSLSAGWRQVRLADGYEAQRWEGGKLVASVWRPKAFDDAAWGVFTRTAVDGAEEAPERAPPAQTLPVVADPALLILGGRRGGVESWAQPAAAFGVALALGLGAFFAGQAVRLDALADRAAAETTVLAAARPASEVGRLRAQLARLDGFSTLLDRPDPSASLAIAVGILQLYGQPPTSFSADGERVRLELPYSALAVATELAGEFASAGGFTDVEVSTGANRSSVIFEMTPPAADAQVSMPVGPARPILAAAPASTDPNVVGGAIPPSGAGGPSRYQAAQAEREARRARDAEIDARRQQARSGLGAPVTLGQPQGAGAAPVARQPDRRPLSERSATPSRPAAQTQPRGEVGADGIPPGMAPVEGGDIPESIRELARQQNQRPN